MAHTFANLLTHIVFSTKDRLGSIRPEFKADLWAYLGGIAREIKGKAIIVNGTTEILGRALRLVQTGNVQTYAFVFVVGVAVVLYVFLKS